MSFFKLLLKLFKGKQAKDAKKKNKNKPPKHQQQFVAVQQPVPIQQSIQGGKVTYVQPVQQQQQYVQVPVVQQQQQFVQQQPQAFNPQAAANKVMAQQMAGYANNMTGNKIPQKYVNQGATYAAGYMGGKQQAPVAQAGGYYAVAA